MKALILLALVLATASAVKQPVDPTEWVPTEYVNLLNDSSLYDWTWGYKLGPKNKYGFVGDTCGDQAVFGANVAGKGTPITTDVALDAPIYSYIIEATVWMIDSYDHESIIGNVNGEKIFDFSKAYDEGTSLCGNVHYSHWREVHEKVIVENKLSANEFEFELTSSLNQAPHDESIGMSEFRLWVAYCHPACASCEGQGNGQCIECALGYQKDDHGSCIPHDMGLTLTIDDEVEFGKLGTFSIGDTTYSEGDAFPGQQCGEHTVFGAGVANRDMVATFKPNPRATECAVQLDVWMIDSWDKECLYVDFEGKNLAYYVYDVDEEGLREDQCGQDVWGDRTFRVLSHMVPYHEGEELTLRLGASLDQDAGDESFGISNIRLYCEICHPSCGDCNKSNDKYACTSCPEGQLLHVLRGEDEGECLNPTGACHLGFLNDDGICEEQCEPESSEASEAISFLKGQEPDLLAETKRDYVHLVFKTDLPDVCYRGFIDIAATWDKNLGKIDTHMYPNEDRTKWQTDVYLMDHQLNDPEVCETHRDHGSDTTIYDCDIKFVAKFLGDKVETWKSRVSVEFVDDLPNAVHVIEMPVEDNDVDIGEGEMKISFLKRNIKA